MRGVVLLLLAALAGPARAELVSDLVDVEGARANRLVGYGIVVGLAGTGDDKFDYTVQSLKNAVGQLGTQLPPALNPGAKNAAAVMVTADLPAFARPGQAVDVTVSAIGKAKSLRGGTLLMTQMVGVDARPYALAQGNISVGGLGVEGSDRSSLIVNVPTVGRIIGGAIVERSVDTGFAASPSLRLSLRRPDFARAERVALAINAALGPIATPLDGGTIDVRAPGTAPARVALLSRIGALEVTLPAPSPRVIVNARTGTVVITNEVRVSPVAVAHGTLTVRVKERVTVSQPQPFGRGTTAVTPDSDIAAEAERIRAVVLDPGVSLRSLVDAINGLGATPADLVAILEAIREAGALRAELVVI